MTRRLRIVVGGLVTFSLLGVGGLAGATGTVEAVDRALEAGDIARADREWRTAYTTAVRSRSWRALADLGDAALRIGVVAGQRPGYVPRAREAYFAALVQARADRSREGVTRMRHAFRALGDHELALQCALIAERLPARDADAARVTSRPNSGGGSHGSNRDR